MTEGGMKEVCVAMMLHLLLLLYKCVFCLCREDCESQLNV